MDQKNAKAASNLPKKKAANKWLQLANQIIYLSIILVSSSITACEKSPLDTEPVYASSSSTPGAERSFKSFLKAADDY
jgi:hypothetical protein